MRSSCCLCVPPNTLNSELWSQATARLTCSHGNEYTDNNRRTAGRSVFCAAQVYQILSIQNVPRGKVSILGGHTVGHSKQKIIYVRVSYSEQFLRYSYFTVQLQTINTPCPRMNCKVHWCWRWNFRKYIILCKLCQLCHLNNKYRY
jgi:hypothetical protein